MLFVLLIFACILLCPHDGAVLDVLRPDPSTPSTYCQEVLNVSHQKDLVNHIVLEIIKYSYYCQNEIFVKPILYRSEVLKGS